MLQYPKHIIFCEVVTAVKEELELENNPLLDEESIDKVDLDKEFLWDQLIIDEDDDGDD